MCLRRVSGCFPLGLYLEKSLVAFKLNFIYNSLDKELGQRDSTKMQVFTLHAANHSLIAGAVRPP